MLTLLPQGLPRLRWRAAETAWAAEEGPLAQLRGEISLPQPARKMSGMIYLYIFIYTYVLYGVLRNAQLEQAPPNVQGRPSRSPEDDPA